MTDAIALACACAILLAFADHGRAYSRTFAVSIAHTPLGAKGIRSSKNETNPSGAARVILNGAARNGLLFEVRAGFFGIVVLSRRKACVLETLGSRDVAFLAEASTTAKK